MMITEDPVRDAERYYEEQDEWLNSRPVCAWCHEPITEEFYYDILGEKVCSSCIGDCREYID